MTEQLRSVGDIEIDYNSIQQYDWGFRIFHSGEGAAFTVQGARALRDWLNKALPAEGIAHCHPAAGIHSPQNCRCPPQS